MGIVFQDAFTGTINDDLVTVHDGTNWLGLSTGSAKLTGSNQLTGSVAPGLGATMFYVGTPALNADHYAQAKYISGNYPALIVGLQTGVSTGSYYVMFHDTGNIYKATAGSLSSALGTVGGVSAGDTYYLQKTESGGNVTLIAKINGVTVGSPITDSSSPFLGGTAGILFYAGGGVIDDFEAGNVSSSTANTLNVAAGSYGVTGANIASLVGINAVAGSYAISGVDAELVYAAAGAGTANTLTLSPGSYTVTGIDFTNISDINILASAGAYAITGRLAALQGPLDPPLVIGGGRSRDRSRAR